MDDNSKQVSRQGMSAAQPYNKVDIRFSGWKIFSDLLAKHNKFKNLLGRTDVIRWVNHDKDSRFVGFGYTNNGRYDVPSEFWRFNPADNEAGGIVRFSPTDDGNLAHFVILWVPQYLGNKGLGTIIMEEIQNLIIATDDICSADNPQYNDREVSSNSFSMMLYPNPFTVSDWTLNQDENTIDWSNAIVATKNIRCELNRQLPDEDRRVSWENLRDWYIRLGWVQVPEMHFVNLAEDDENPVNFPVVSRRTIMIKRYPMLFPVHNAELFGKVL